MRRKYRFALLAMTLAASNAGSATASDTATCPTGMICASDPGTIVAALQSAGYKPALTVDRDGDPEIDSLIKGRNVAILFYDCTEHKQCKAIQFRITFKTDPTFSLAVANKWNVEKRLFRAYVLDDGRMIFDHDVSTIGGLNKANFLDLIEWLGSTIGDVDQYLGALPAKS
ncbi:MAG: YbjN domain-containing protein [Sphingomonas sp.]|uniref:YbjN domain-containing protein n=1 Tax=Sphingomonas sp. TaxID=28214 RepID=UPI001AC5F2A5|nr:YbjN domain-containing protein [Sphingomonas sp.]MBN8807496.1 YbjN domain-containing protein [Sphingomonas sp.]